MNRLFLFNILIVFFIVTACSGKDKKNEKSPILFPPELVDFVPYEHNPVFTGTGEDTWDYKIRERGYILLEDGIYKMWYTGHNGSEGSSMYLGYATSTDGIHWTRYLENPIFNEYWTEDVQVVKHDGRYYMVAEGVNDIAHMLISKNGTDWERLGDLDIRKVNGESIGPGAYGTPTLWIENNKWYLFYERGDLGIWLAESSDQKVWTNIQDDPVIKMGPEKYDARGLALNQIIKYNERYYAYFHGTPDEDWSSWNSNVAVSDDLIHWKKYENNPIVNGDSISNNYSSPILVNDGTKYRLYTMHESVRIFIQGEENNQ
ncbi:MAG: hypothetical protein J7L04_13965 [Bacteroidales bacterium]|nr:hypothetical protein [Bacteroidales bacterium]